MMYVATAPPIAVPATAYRDFIRPPLCNRIRLHGDGLRADTGLEPTRDSISTREEGRMSAGEKFSTDEARDIGEQIGIDWGTSPFDVEEFRSGLHVELEHGLHDILTNVTDDDPLVTGKIALAHLREFPDYYTRLEQMEEQAKRDHGEA
jgi:hypothetical protein